MNAVSLITLLIRMSVVLTVTALTTWAPTLAAASMVTSYSLMDGDVKVTQSTPSLRQTVI